MNATATKALIYATAIADRLIEKHGPQTDKVIEHQIEWPFFWPRRLRPPVGRMYQGGARHLEVTIILTPDFFRVRLVYGKIELPRTTDGQTLH